MNQEIKELRLLLADVIEGLAVADRRIADLSASLMAMRLALGEVSPERFEPSYAKHFEGPECVTVRQRSAADVQILLASAQKLRE